jgi:NTE family protein
MKNAKIALILGGGGARGLAHIGVLRALEEHKIPIDMIIGTSMGAMIGAAYAQNPDASAVGGRFSTFLQSEEFESIGITRFEKEQSEPDDLLNKLAERIKRRVVINLAANRKSLFRGERLMIAIRRLVDSGLIEECRIPFACSALNISNMEEIIFDQGDIRRAVTASSSIPGFLPPIEMDGQLYIDGSVCTNFPWQYAKDNGADIIIAVDVTLENIRTQNPDNVIDIIIRTNMAANLKINRIALDNVDYVIRPPLGRIYWNEFDRFESLMELGYRETKKHIDNLEKIIKFHNKISTRLKKKIISRMRL